MSSQSKAYVKGIILFLAVCAGSLVFSGWLLAGDLRSLVYESPSTKIMTASETMQRWSKPAVPEMSFTPVSIPRVSFQSSENFLQNYMASLSQGNMIRPAITNLRAVNTPVLEAMIVRLQPAIVTPVLAATLSRQIAEASGAAVSPVIQGSGYVPAIAPQINTNNGGEWTYSAVDPAIINMVRSGSQTYVGQRISFSAGGNEFSGIVMAAEPNAMAVRADNSAWFGLITTTSSDSLTIIPLTLFDEGTGDLSSVEVLNNGATLRMSGVDYDGEPGTVEFDIVRGVVAADPTASQLSELTLTDAGVVYELIPNPANGLNLMRVNGVSFEDGSIVIND